VGHRRNRGSYIVGAAEAALIVLLALAGPAVAQPSPAEEARLKKLDAGPKTIDVSKYPPEQQQAYKLFQAKCSTCHAVARGVNTDMVLPAEWERYVRRMMYKPNSGISSDEGRTLYRFMVYDASVRKPDLLRKALVGLPAAERPAALEKIRGVNPAFTEP
jgi:hypothetical protein